VRSENELGSYPYLSPERVNKPSEDRESPSAFYGRKFIQFVCPSVVVERRNGTEKPRITRKFLA
jgi:hypothetical protein